MANSNLDGHHEELVPVKELSYIPSKISPQEIFYLQDLPPDDLREKYLRINEDFLTLKKFTRAQEDKIMRLQAKLQKITTDQKKGSGTSRELESMRHREIELSEEILTLKQMVSQLQHKNENLEAKLKVANVQLSSVRQSRVPMSYRHISSRIDTGLRRGRKAKSLTNITKSMSAWSKDSERERTQQRRNEDFSEDQNASLGSSPRYEGSDEMSHQVRFVLEEARKRIIELEEDQEQLLQQLSDTHQNAEDQERECREKMTSLERELEARREESRERKLQEHREKTALIRSERQSRAASARMSALSDHVNDLEAKLFHEKKLKEEALEAIEMRNIEENEQAVRIKEGERAREKLKDEVEELKNNNLYFKKQVKQLQSENERLAEICLHESKSGPKKRDDVKSILQKEVKLLHGQLEGEKTKTWSLREQLLAAEERARTFEAEIEQLKIKMEELNQKVDEKDSLGHKLEETKEIIKETPKTCVDKITLDDLKKSVEEYKNSQKVNVFDKMAYDELQNKYTELQLIYREKNMELDKITSLLNGHANTYEQLRKENQFLQVDFGKEQEKAKAQMRELENTLKRKEDTISGLEKQLTRLSQEQFQRRGSNSSEQRLKEDVIDALTLNKHHNVLELSVEKVALNFAVKDTFKTFVSWVMPWPLRDPLQHTNFALGAVGFYKHTSLYKFKMSYHNLLAIKEDTLKAMLYVLPPSNHPQKIGKCQISLAELLTRPHNTLHGTVAIEKSLDVGDENDLSCLPDDLTNSPDFSADEDSDCIGVLYYSMRFHRSGKDYLESFQRKLAERTASWPFAKRIKEPTTSIEDVSERLSLALNLTVPSGELSKSCKPDRKDETATPSLSESNSCQARHSSGYYAKSVTGTLHIDPTGPDSPVMHVGTRSGSTGDEEDKSNSAESSSSLEVRRSIIEVRGSATLEPSERSRHDAARIVPRKGSGDSDSPLATTDSNSYLHSANSVQGSFCLRKTDVTEMASDKMKGGKHEEEEKEEEEERGEGKDKEPKEGEDQDGGRSKARRTSLRLSKHLKGVFRSKKTTKTADDANSSTEKSKEATLKSASLLSRSSKLLSASSSKWRRGKATSVLLSRGKAIPRRESLEEDEEQEEKKEERIEEEEEDEEEETSSVSSDTYFEESRSQSSKASATSGVSRTNGLPPEKNKEEGKTAKNTFRVSSAAGLRRADSDVSQDSPDLSKSSSDDTSPSEPSDGLSSDGVAENGILRIEIVGLELRDSPLAQDTSVHYLFVDYIGFLDLDPEVAETPQSLPKPAPREKIYFNFVNEIPVSKEENPRRFKALRGLLKRNGDIIFNLASEPPPDQQQENCKELGFGTLQIREMLNGFEGGIQLYDLDHTTILGTLYVHLSFCKE